MSSAAESRQAQSPVRFSYLQLCAQPLRRCYARAISPLMTAACVLLLVSACSSEDPATPAVTETPAVESGAALERPRMPAGNTSQVKILSRESTVETQRTTRPASGSGDVARPAPVAAAAATAPAESSYPAPRERRRTSPDYVRDDPAFAQPQAAASAAPEGIFDDYGRVDDSGAEEATYPDRSGHQGFAPGAGSILPSLNGTAGGVRTSIPAPLASETDPEAAPSQLLPDALRDTDPAFAEARRSEPGRSPDTSDLIDPTENLVPDFCPPPSAGIVYQNIDGYSPEQFALAGCEGFD